MAQSKPPAFFSIIVFEIKISLPKKPQDGECKMLVIFYCAIDILQRDILRETSEESPVVWRQRNDWLCRVDKNDIKRGLQNHTCKQVHNLSIVKASLLV